MYPICRHCGEPIVPDDYRFGAVFHHDCMIRLVVGSLGHQKRICHCYGGTQEDPPELSRREAARAAADYFRELHPVSEEDQ